MQNRGAVVRHKNERRSSQEGIRQRAMLFGKHDDVQPDGKMERPTTSCCRDISDSLAYRRSALDAGSEWQALCFAVE